ncbi:MAG: N-acetyl sugar amidotransferase, partial [Candidatus Omnitrophota bacterium]|nr:N-acetyl sugar amidotransferase [Candidatus Omnitrophota bacterium]
MRPATKTSTGKELEVKYGLPRKVKFCKICCITNQRPCSVNEYSHSSDSKKKTIVFDEEGICAACRNKEKQHQEIDWEDRDKKLRDLCDRFRRDDGYYDCIVPGSGGKDSVFASHLLKYKYGMHPLTVTWSPHMYTEIGWKNFQNWIHKGGFDNYLLTPNGKVHRLLTRLAVINLLHPFQPFILGQKTFVAKMCDRFNIPLAFYGEMPGEYGTTEGTSLGDEMKFADLPGAGFSKDMMGGRDLKELYLGGTKVGELID